MDVLCLSWDVYAILSILCSLAIILTKKRELVALLLLTCQMSYYCKCSLAQTHGVVGWSAVCDCGIS